MHSLVTIPRTIAVLVLAFASPAIAQAPQCAGLADALAGLAATYGEEPRVTAMMTGGNVLVITAAPSGGWTALEVRPDGTACIVAAGEAFGTIAPGDPV
jgi:hypothetical protein